MYIKNVNSCPPTTSALEEDEAPQKPLRQKSGWLPHLLQARQTASQEKQIQMLSQADTLPESCSKYVCSTGALVQSPLFCMQQKLREVCLEHHGWFLNSYCLGEKGRALQKT